MLEFKVIKQSQKSRARLGTLYTPHGIVETPTLVPVATNAALKALPSEFIEGTKTNLLIANTFHLHLQPGERIVKKVGGLHSFMNWPKSLMTDSGGFQVFSLGFGHDFAVGKILKMFPGKKREEIDEKSQPRKVKITDEGVFFQSPRDGHEIFLGPSESIRIQEKLGADIIFAFDECTPPLANFSYARSALARTHRWAQTCIDTKKSDQALFGIIQGSHFRQLREESAKFINSLPFNGFGIGGDLGQNKTTMRRILDWVMPALDPRKPRHLLGIGYPEDIATIIRQGIDIFDCIVPTHHARRGIAFTSRGALKLAKSEFLADTGPLDKSCSCMVCQNYRRSYLAHLVRAKEMGAATLLTFHNLFFFNTFVEKIREKIKRGQI